MLETDRFTILLVDDQPEIIQELVGFCELHFPEARILQTVLPLQAIVIAELEQPDVILTDWDMPKLNGLELLQRLNDNPRVDEDTSIILCSGKNISSQDLYKALKAGANDYIRKPFELPELIARITSALREQHRLREVKSTREALAVEKERNEALLKERIDFQQLDIESLALELQTNRAVNESVVDKLDKLTRHHPLVGQVVRDLRFQLQTTERLQVLKNDLAEVNAAFYSKLHERFPELTANEVELCALFRIGLSNKEIAATKGISFEGVKKGRQRLRKKLGLVASQDLIVFLKSLI